MKEFSRVRFICAMVLTILLFFLFMPYQINALRALADEDLSQNPQETVKRQSDLQSDSGPQPLNEMQLDELSPELIVPSKVQTPPPQYNNLMNQEFKNSICFKHCHHISDFYPSHNTAKQWRLLIQEDGHSLFQKIQWENPQQKEEILNYLLNNARNTRPEAAGIGVW